MPSALGLSLLAILVVAFDAPALVRVPVGLAALLLAPGYALVGALFPNRPQGGPDMEIDAGASSPMSAAMRFGLGIALSTAILILVVIAVESAGPLRELRVLFALAAVTAAANVGWFARIARDRPRPAPSRPLEPGQRESRSLALLLVAAMILAGLAAGYALLKPREASEFTTLYLTAADGVQHCYPDRYAQGAYGFDRRDGCDGIVAGSMVVGVVNYEGRAMDYWLRAVWTREVLAEDNFTDILEAQVIHSWQVSLDPVQPPHDPSLPEPQYEVPLVLPPPPGNGTWRMSVQLYTQAPPPVTETRDFLESPYKRVHLVVQAVV